MKKLLVVGLLLGLAASANAATVTFTVDLSVAGQYEVRATCDGAYGLALYNFTLTGATTIENMGPAAYFQSYSTKTKTYSYAPRAGFTLFRSGMGTIPANPVGGSQDTISGNPADKFLYVGQVADDLSLWTPYTTGASNWYIPSGGAYDADVLLAQGTRTGDVTLSAVPTDQTVFSHDNYEDMVNEYAEAVEIVYVPEPATIGLLALGLLALLRRKR